MRSGLTCVFESFSAFTFAISQIGQGLRGSTERGSIALSPTNV